MQQQQDRTAQLQRERELGRPAALAAFGSALLMVAGLYVGQRALKDQPLANRPDLVRFLSHHSGDLIVGGVLGAIGFALLAVVAYYLYVTTRARKDDLFRSVLVVGVMGPLLYALASIGRLISLTSASADYADRTTQTIQAASDILRGSTSTGSSVFLAALWAGTMALGFWLVMGSLYAMRVGLLTRPMGVLGIILAAGTVLQVAFAPVLTVFWLIALGVLFLGYWPGGRPKAWETGTAVPWPTAKERAAAAESGARASGR